MKYNINTPAPRWAVREARLRCGYPVEGSGSIDLLDWGNCLKPLRHMSHLVALTEEEPVDPLVLKARKLYCAVNDIDEEFIEKNGGWGGGIRREAVARVVEFFNAEA